MSLIQITSKFDNINTSSLSKVYINKQIEQIKDLLDKKLIPAFF